MILGIQIPACRIEKRLFHGGGAFLRANILTDGKKRIYSSRYALSSLVFCGHCGDIYRRIKWNNRGCKSTVWRCVSRVLKKSSGIDCPARTIHEEDMQAAVLTAVNDAWSRRIE